MAGCDPLFPDFRWRKLTGNSGDIATLAERLGYKFGQPELLLEALTHQSVADAKSNSRMSYERLEFLGDRVLGLVIADILAKKFPDDSVGDLARRHVDLVRAEALTKVARDIGVASFIQLTPGEEKSGARASASIQADVMEAVLAALYLDGGLDAAQKFIETGWARLLDNQAAPPSDAKTELQEWLQGRGRALPDYVEVDRQGPDHAPVFTIELRVDGEAPERAQGVNKRAAEMQAATAMLIRFEGDLMGKT